LTATPKTTQEKIEAAMRISNLKSCYPWIYEKEAFNKKLIQEYIRKIKFYLEKGKINVANPFDGIDKGFSKDATRDMRDFNKFLELLPSYAIFKLFQRPIMTIAGHRYLIPTIQDALNAKEAFDNIIETTKTGTDARIIEFYSKYVANQFNGSDAETLTDLYNKGDDNKGRKHKLSVTRIRAWLIRLEQLNWVDIREAKDVNSKGYVDRRYNSYFPLKNITPNALITAISVDLEPILKEAFETWLKNTLTETDSVTQFIILNIDGTATEITLEEMKALIIKTGGGNNKECIINQGLSSESNNKGESTLIPEKSVIGVILEVNPEKDTDSAQLKEGVPSVPPFPDKLKVINEESGLKRLEVNPDSKVLFAKRVKPVSGQRCQGEGKGSRCTLEATWNLNGNLYCDDHFDASKKSCEENGYTVELVKVEAS
jgi:hypothetical protein